MYNDAGTQDPTTQTSGQPSGGWVINPDGSVTGPDGTHYPIGSTLPDGSAVTPGRFATTPLKTSLSNTDPTGAFQAPPPQPQQPSAAPSAPAPSGGGTNTGGSIIAPGSIGSLLTAPPYTAPTYVNPSYVAPNYPAPPTIPTLPSFVNPTAADVNNLPGYQFARDQGVAALDSSAAARGVSNTGGTLEDIIKFGDQFAGQNYQTARQNALDTYNTNLQTQYILPYQAAYNQWSIQNPQAAADAASRTNFNVGNAGNQNAFNWNTAQMLYNVGRNTATDNFNRLYSVASLGAGVQ